MIRKLLVSLLARAMRPMAREYVSGAHAYDNDEAARALNMAQNASSEGAMAPHYTRGASRVGALYCEAFAMALAHECAKHERTCETCARYGR